MFSYDSRDAFAAPAIRRALGPSPGGDEPTLTAVCRQLGRVIVGWLLAVIAIQLAVKYWGAAL